MIFKVYKTTEDDIEIEKEINTLEELVNFAEENAGIIIIVNGDEKKIEIYDDYRE